MTTKRKAPASAWKPGQSGNPQGRKPGTGEVAELRAAISERVPKVLEAMLKKALAGDVGAARLLLERAVAPLKAADAPVVINLSGKSLADQGRAVLVAVADGQLAPAQGAALVSAIGTLANVEKVEELAARVAALEKSKARK